MDKQELQKWYDNYFDMFASEGWKQHIEELGVGVEAMAKELELAKDEVTIYRLQGKLHLARSIINKEDMHKTVYDDLKDQGNI